MDLDILIKGGTVLDGTGARARKADVALSGGRVVDIGIFPQARAARAINAAGLSVSPGFIDIHGHSDLSMLACPEGDSKIMQGVTTEVAGNCGESAGPLTEKNRSDYCREAEEYGLKIDWSSLGGFLDRLEGKISLNYATLLGLGTLRGAVIGTVNRPPDLGEMRKMRGMLGEAMEQGALGISTGLAYAPGMYARTAEIVELVKSSHPAAVVYATHMREEGDGILAALEEAITIGRQSDMPVQISHFKTVGTTNWGRMPEALAALDRACGSGLDIWADRYPYTASATGLASIFPAWSHEGGRAGLLALLKDGAQRKRLELEVNQSVCSLGWERIVISNARSEEYASIEGMSIADGADLRMTEPFDLAAGVLKASAGLASIVAFSQDENDMLLTLAHPRVMLGSDSGVKSKIGLLGKGKPHPRCYGAFPAFYRIFVREKRLLSPEEAVRKMTGLPAERMGLRERGLLKKNFRADVVVFDPEKIEDTATYGEPHSYPRGIEFVIVNGEVAVEKGVSTRSRRGVVLRSRG